MRGFATRGEANTPNEVSAEFPIGNWYWLWQHLQVFGCLSWRVELELESGIGDLRILCGTLLFVSRFSTLNSQSNPKTQLRALGELGVRQLGIGIGIGNIFPSLTL